MSKIDELNKLYAEMSATFTEKLVFGDGNIESGILFIGEAPGSEEILQEKPFVGKAGKNLDSFLKTLELSRETSYITNAVKFRPSKTSDKGNTVNRTPTTEEIIKFEPFLAREIRLLEPKIIITLGSIPLRASLGIYSLSISVFHGKLFTSDKYGCKIFHLYHPASIIYNQSLEKTYSEDILALKSILEALD